MPPPSVSIAAASSATSTTSPTSRSGPASRPASSSTAGSIAARAVWPARSATSSSDPGGARCACGQDGCLETLVSGSGIARLARAAVDAGRPTELPPHATAIDVYRAAASGDPLATEIADAVGRRLAWAVHLLVMAYDVERVVLGGGVSHAGETFMRPIQRELDRMRASSALAREQLTPDIVELLPPGADAGAWGAVVIAATAHAAEVGAGHGWEEVGHVRDT